MPFAQARKPLRKRIALLAPGPRKDTFARVARGVLNVTTRATRARTWSSVRRRRSSTALAREVAPSKALRPREAIRESRQSVNQIVEGACGIEPERAFVLPSFEEVYSSHLSFLWRSLRLLGVKDHLLEDACQDVATVIFRRLPEFEGRSSLRTWLYGIAQGVASNHRRRVVRKDAPLVGTEDLPAGLEMRAAPREAALEAADSIIRFSDTLSDADRDLFALGLVEQIPAVELAGELGLRVADVRQRVSRLRERFRRFVSGPSPRNARPEACLARD
jgi:RNA polymerase sigma-70 factor (ECF subfamily)